MQYVAKECYQLFYLGKLSIGILLLMLQNIIRFTSKLDKLISIMHLYLLHMTRLSAGYHVSSK